MMSNMFTKNRFDFWYLVLWKLINHGGKDKAIIE
jgi:hypothetical protein